jgi:undecaprenyl-diphosphatase
MKDRLIKNKKIIVIAFFSIMFLLILRDVFIYEVTSYDNWAYDVFVDNLRSNNMTLFMMIITAFGNAFTLIGIILLFFLLSKNKKNGIYLSINIILIFLTNIIVKAIIQRPRPSGYNLIVENNYSFPSGHAMVSTAFYGFIIYLIYKNIKNKKLKWFLISTIFLLIILIMISRIYLGVHYLSDTLAGFSLAIVYLMIFITYIYNSKLLERE